MSRVSLLDERLARQIFRRRIAATGNAGPSLLFDYEAGDVIAGESFARASTATYYDSNNVLQIAASGEKRDSHYVNGERRVLLERQSTNAATHGDDLGVAVADANYANYGSSNTVSNASTGSDGNATMVGLIPPNTASISGRYGSVSASVDQKVAISVEAKQGLFDSCFVRADGPGAVYSQFNLVTGVWDSIHASHSNTFARQLANGTWRFGLVATPTAGQAINLVMVGPADSVSGQNITGNGVTPGIYVARLQVEVGKEICSSYIPNNTTSPVTRAADALKFPISFNPQELTLYVKWEENGLIGRVPFPSVVTLGDTGGAGKEVFGLMGGPVPGTPYLIAERYTGSEANSVQSVAPSIGDSVEGRAVLKSTGAVICGQSLNGAAETVGAESGTPALTSGWSEDFINVAFNDAGFANNGSLSLAKIKVIAGVKTLDEMRAL